MSRNGLAATLRTGADVSYQGHRKVKFTASGSLAERIMEEIAYEGKPWM